MNSITGGSVTTMTMLNPKPISWNKFIEQPPTVQAVQLTEENKKALISLLSGEGGFDERTWWIKFRSAGDNYQKLLRPGDWLIRRGNFAYDVVEADEFEKLFKEA